jgi:hypothetical protein
MTTYYSEFQKVLLSVDCIIFGFDNNKLKILIGKRNMDPVVANGASTEASYAATRVWTRQHTAHYAN